MKEKAILRKIPNHEVLFTDLDGLDDVAGANADGSDERGRFRAAAVRQVRGNGRTPNGNRQGFY
jgi:hypothetical protein